MQSARCFSLFSERFVCSVQVFWSKCRERGISLEGMQTALAAAKSGRCLEGKYKSKGPTFVGPLLEGIGLRGQDLNL